MKKYLLISVLFLSSSWLGFAQEIGHKDIMLGHFVVVPKTIVDYSQINFFYLLEYYKDPVSHKKKIEAQTFLQIGESGRCFRDYYAFLFDSINDVAASLKEENKMKQTTALMNIAKKVKYNHTLVWGHHKDMILRQRSVVLNEIYQYEDSIPSLQWQLLDKDTVILDHPCHQASCEYRGRTYRAWYADDVDLPYGPYVFEGLPGLIFQIEDMQKHYCFKLNGINHVSHKQPIYFNTSDKVVPTTRERVRKIYKQYCEHPLHSIVQSNPAIKIPQSALMNEKSKPYNPIELK
ncbi:MAG: GLPGLI family protein [Prolixibacteraceae bacterium]